MRIIIIVCFMTLLWLRSRVQGSTCKFCDVRVEDVIRFDFGNPGCSQGFRSRRLLQTRKSQGRVSGVAFRA